VLAGIILANESTGAEPIAQPRFAHIALILKIFARDDGIAQ